jgi:hypothetical protein
LPFGEELAEGELRRSVWRLDVDDSGGVMAVQRADLLAGLVDADLRRYLQRSAIDNNV